MAYLCSAKAMIIVHAYVLACLHLLEIVRPVIAGVAVDVMNMVAWLNKVVRMRLIPHKVRPSNGPFAKHNKCGRVLCALFRLNNQANISLANVPYAIGPIVMLWATNGIAPFLPIGRHLVTWLEAGLYARGVVPMLVSCGQAVLVNSWNHLAATARARYFGSFSSKSVHLFSVTSLPFGGRHSHNPGSIQCDWRYYNGLIKLLQALLLSREVTYGIRATFIRRGLII